MKRLLLLLPALFPAALQAQYQADQYYEPGEMAMAREMMLEESGGQTSWLILGERLESRLHEGEASAVWEGQGWIGKDLRRLWVKTEGHIEDGDTEEGELQLLYSRAVSPFWDIQAGLRHDFAPDPSRNYAVLGLQGLAPYWFELDAAAFLSEEGDASARLEAEYELRFTQRLILQPRAEFNYAFHEDPEIALGKGMSGVHLGLRLRYELRREFAPYIGVEWERAYGGSADFLRRAGEPRERFSFIAGIRFWY